jgi:hypothetical protein
VETADEGYFFAVGIHQPLTINAAALVGVADNVGAYQFVLPFRIVVRRITWELTTGVNGSFSSVGLYNADGSVRLVHVGALASEIADQGIIDTAVTAVTIEPGIYYFAQTSTSASVIGRKLFVDNFGELILNEGSTNAPAGIAANSGSSGVLPATLGAITASTSRDPLVCVFKP